MTIRGLFIMAACVSCWGCRAGDPSHPQDSAASAGNPPAAAAQAPSAGCSSKPVVPLRVGAFGIEIERRRYYE